MAHWQVIIIDSHLSSVKPASEGQPAEAKPRKTVLDIVKTGKVYHVETVDLNDARVSIWCQGTIEFVQKSGWKEPMMMTAPIPGGDYIDFTRSDFPDCAWISKKNYMGVEKQAGHDCLIFADKVLPGSDPALAGIDNGTEIAAESTAYIDVQTRLPLLVRRTTEVLTYQWLPAPPAMQTLPPALEADIKREQQRQADLIRRPAQS
jgi:hypothetical protein